MSSSKFVKSMIGNTEKFEVSTSSYVSKNEDWKFSVARVMLTGTLKNQYARSADDAAKEALPLLISAAKTDPMYVLKAACFARDNNLKGMVKCGLAAVAGNASDEFLCRDDVRNCAIGLLQTFHPGQLLQFVELMKSKQCGRGFGSRSQRWVQEVMQNWTEERIEEFTLKYPTAFNSLLRLVHPNLDQSQGELARYVLTSTGPKNRNGKASGEKQIAVEYLKNNATNTKLVANTMLDKEIPWDVIKGFAKMDKDVWTAAMTQMGLSALLLNMRSLDEHGVFNTSDGLTALKLKLSEVKDGRSLPIDFAKPYVHCANQKVRAILLDAMAAVLQVDMPALQGKRVGVSVDISGSMQGEPLQTAGLLAVPFVKSNLWFTTFNTSLHEESTAARASQGWYGSRDSGVCPKINGLEPRKQIENLLSLQAGGGTDVGASIRQAIQDNRKLDLMVIISDEAQNSGTPLTTVWNQYKRQVNPRAELWVVNATNTEWHAADFNDSSITVYQTMSPAMFKNLQFVGQDLVSAVENYALKTFKTRDGEVMSKSRMKRVAVQKKVAPKKKPLSKKFVEKVLVANKKKSSKISKKKNKRR